MPTTYSWTGETSGDPSVSTNYDLNTGTPDDGDSLKFNQGAAPINTNQDALAAKTLVLLSRNDGYTGAWGDAANHFKVGAATLEYDQADLINVVDYLEGAFSSIKIADTGQGTLYLKVTGNPRIEIERGKVVILEGSEYGDVINGRGIVTIEGGATHQAGKKVYNAESGHVNIHGAVNNIDGSKGTFTLHPGSSVAGTVYADKTFVDIRTAGTIAAIRNLTPNHKGWATRNAHTGYAITAIEMHARAVNDIPANDTLGTVGSIVKVNSLIDPE